MVKTRIQVRAEGIGIRQLGIYAGYNPNKIFREIHAQGNGMKGLYAGQVNIISPKITLLVSMLLSWPEVLISSPEISSIRSSTTELSPERQPVY